MRSRTAAPRARARPPPSSSASPRATPARRGVARGRPGDVHAPLSRAPVRGRRNCQFHSRLSGPSAVAASFEGPGEARGRVAQQPRAGPGEVSVVGEPGLMAASVSSLARSSASASRSRLQSFQRSGAGRPACERAWRGVPATVQPWTRAPGAACSPRPRASRWSGRSAGPWPGRSRPGAGASPERGPWRSGRLARPPGCRRLERSDRERRSRSSRPPRLQHRPPVPVGIEHHRHRRPRGAGHMRQIGRDDHRAASGARAVLHDLHLGLQADDDRHAHWR